jgi:ketosteroid isomerase-like protein
VKTDVQDIQRLYDAFNQRDIEAVLQRLAPDVRWANGMEGGYVDGRDAVREYWTRQFELINSHVEPEEIERGDGMVVVVKVHQVVRSREGELLADDRVTHIFTFRDGQVLRFDIDSRGQVRSDGS